LVRNWDRLLSVAEIQENLGDWDAALGTLEEAMGHAANANPEDTALVRSRLAALRARKVTAKQ